jgi:uncharacterized protein YbjT (DUF2867 family)
MTAVAARQESPPYTRGETQAGGALPLALAPAILFRRLAGLFMWKCRDGIAAAAGVKDDDSMILVTGATGLSGSAVIRACVDTRLPVRALVRDPAKAAVLSIPDTVEVAESDMLKPATLDGVLDGVERALMISGPDEHMLETQCTFIDAAKRAGVRHIVKLSGMGCWSDAKFRFARMHAEIEKYLEGSGVAWTHLRPSTFMQTFLREVPTILCGGTLNLPMADARLSPVDIDDIARVAVALLRGTGHEGKRYEMTGPEALATNEIAERISSPSTDRFATLTPIRRITGTLCLRTGSPPTSPTQWTNCSANGATAATNRASTSARMGCSG